MEAKTYWGIAKALLALVSVLSVLFFILLQVLGTFSQEASTFFFFWLMFILIIGGTTVLFFQKNKMGFYFGLLSGAIIAICGILLLFWVIPYLPQGFTAIATVILYSIPLLIGLAIISATWKSKPLFLK